MDDRPKIKTDVELSAKITFETKVMRNREKRNISYSLKQIERNIKHIKISIKKNLPSLFDDSINDITKTISSIRTSHIKIQDGKI